MRGYIRAALPAATLLLAACAHQSGFSAEGLGTSVPGGHIANVTRDVKGWHNAQNPDCPFSRAVKAAVIERDRDGVTERWTIEGCNGRLFDYEAYIMPMGGGITVMVSDANASPDWVAQECSKSVVQALQSEVRAADAALNAASALAYTNPTEANDAQAASAAADAAIAQANLEIYRSECEEYR